MTYTIRITSISRQPQTALSHLTFDKSLRGYIDHTEDPIQYMANLLKDTNNSLIVDYISTFPTAEIGVTIYDTHPS
jgi:hypothetical protein